MFKSIKTYSVFFFAVAVMLFVPFVISAQMTANISTNNDAVCEAPNPDITFTGYASGGVLPYKYNWNFGSGQGNSTFNPATWFYTDPGTYTVILTVTDKDGNIEQASTSIEIYELPDVVFLADTTA